MTVHLKLLFFTNISV